jgi:hypothetical protein
MLKEDLKQNLMVSRKNERGLGSVEFMGACNRHRSNVAQIPIRADREKRINRSLIAGVDYQLLTDALKMKGEQKIGNCPLSDLS